MHTLVRATLLNKWNAYYVLKDIVSKSCYEKINQTVYAWNTMPTNDVVNNMISRESMRITLNWTYQQPWECI